jgi:hypothetical protein
MELLKRHGFPPRFPDWISGLLCSSSSRVLINGVDGLPILHGRGLRQGDLMRELLDNAHHEELMVDGILQVNTRHQIPNEQGARFTQVQAPQ